MTGEPPREGGASEFQARASSVRKKTASDRQVSVQDGSLPLVHEADNFACSEGAHVEVDGPGGITDDEQGHERNDTIGRHGPSLGQAPGSRKLPTRVRGV